MEIIKAEKEKKLKAKEEELKAKKEEELKEKEKISKIVLPDNIKTILTLSNNNLLSTYESDPIFNKII